MSSSIDQDDTARGNKDIDRSKRDTPKSISLKVAEAEQRDVGRKIARVDPQVAEQLNITSGDALELTSLGKKTTVLSWPARSVDRGKGLIRVDGYTRNKLDVGINDQIEVKRVESKDAKSITFAPTEPLRIVGAEEYLTEYLSYRPYYYIFMLLSFEYMRCILIEIRRIDFYNYGNEYVFRGLSI